MTGRSVSPEPGWIDPPNPRHTCYDEMPSPLTRTDWQRRWRCSCGRAYRVADSQREGYYFEPIDAAGLLDLPDTKDRSSAPGPTP